MQGRAVGNGRQPPDGSRERNRFRHDPALEFQMVDSCFRLTFCLSAVSKRPGEHPDITRSSRRRNLMFREREQFFLTGRAQGVLAGDVHPPDEVAVLDDLEGEAAAGGVGEEGEGFRVGDIGGLQEAGERQIGRGHFPSPLFFPARWRVSFLNQTSRGGFSILRMKGLPPVRYKSSRSLSRCFRFIISPSAYWDAAQAASRCGSLGRGRSGDAGLRRTRTFVPRRRRCNSTATRASNGGGSVCGDG